MRWAVCTLVAVHAWCAAAPAPTPRDPSGPAVKWIPGVWRATSGEQTVYLWFAPRNMDGVQIVSWSWMDYYSGDYTHEVGEWNMTEDGHIMITQYEVWQGELHTSYRSVYLPWIQSGSTNRYTSWFVLENLIK